MSANWKLWLLSSSLVCSLSCSDTGAGGSIDDGGDSESDGGGSGADAGSSGGDAGRDGSSRDATATSDGSGRDSSSGSRDSSTLGSDSGADDPGCGVLMAKLRDFTPETNPDFETFAGSGATTGVVEDMLDADHLPVFRATQATVTSKSSFDQWYRDVPGVNEAIAVSIPNMSGVDGEYSYSSSAFFPIDNQGFGNYGSTGHNFHFTTQIAANFTYTGGEVFDFEGDDDLWIFVNDRLALDLGGLHPAVQGQIDFDAQASELGIERGKTYRMDIFHAERHTTASNFKFSTTISCFMVPPIYI